MAHMPSLSAAQFAKKFAPSEYGQSWDEVGQHEEFHRPVEGTLSHEEMVKSVKDRGIDIPVIVQGKHVIDGHHRALAAMEANVRIPYDRAPE